MKKKKRLERKWARACLLLVLGGGAVAVAGVLLSALQSWALVLTLLGGAAMIAGAVIRWTKLRCRHCGKWVAKPQWKPGKQQLCRACGNPFLFDDEDGKPRKS